MIHVCDWLPTRSCSRWGTALLRNEILHDIDPITQTAARRVGNYKVIIGDVYKGKWDGWFKPEQVTDDILKTFHKDLMNTKVQLCCYGFHLMIPEQTQNYMVEPGHPVQSQVTGQSYNIVTRAITDVRVNDVHHSCTVKLRVGRLYGQRISKLAMFSEQLQ